MKHSIIGLLLLVLLGFSMPPLLFAATSCTLHIEYQYSPPGTMAISGFNLYQEGVLVYQSFLADSETALDCPVYLHGDSTYFTLTAIFSDGTESPPSPPFFYSVPETYALPDAPLPGFDEQFYLRAKLAALQADPEFSAYWLDKDAAFLWQCLQDLGFTAKSHYQAYGYAEGLAPNAYFNPAEYTLAKAMALFTLEKGYYSIDDALAAFRQVWPGDPYEHYLLYGDQEGINPSNNFDISAYLEEKLAALQANPATASPHNSVAGILAGLQAAGLTTLEHFLQFGIYEGLTAHTVPEAEQVLASAAAYP